MRTSLLQKPRTQEKQNILQWKSDLIAATQTTTKKTTIVDARKTMPSTRSLPDTTKKVRYWVFTLEQVLSKQCLQ
jgi:nicotinate-nucleotide pyrophosphorylase